MPGLVTQVTAAPTSTIKVGQRARQACQELLFEHLADIVKVETLTGVVLRRRRRSMRWRTRQAWCTVVARLPSRC